MRLVRIVLIVCAVLLLPLASLDALAGGGGVARHAGLIHSVRPSDGMLIIEALGRNGVPEVLEVRVRSAKVVRVWRDPVDSWTWRERATSIYRWPVGTFVVVIGRTIHERSVEASRIEIPKITPDSPSGR